MADINDLFYETLKPKEIKILNNRDYVFTGLDYITEMFEYKKDARLSHIDDRTIELILCTNGQIMFTEKDGMIQCGFGYDGGVRDVNGVGNVITGNMLNGEGLSGLNNIDCVLGFNTNSRTPDTMIYKFAHLLTELDVSIENGIIYTRENPIFLAENNGIAEQIKQFFNRIKQGEPLTIARKNKGSVGNVDKMLEQVNMTNSDKVDKLQYLAQMHNAILRRAFTLYGQALAEGTKQAQQSIDEVSANKSSSFIIPFNKLKQRQIMCKRLKKVFGVDMSVDFTTPWKIEIEKWQTEKGDNNDSTGID